SSRLLFSSSSPHPSLTEGFSLRQSSGNSPLLSFPSDEACNFLGNSCSTTSFGRRSVSSLVFVGTTHVCPLRPCGPNNRPRNMSTMTCRCVRCVHSFLLLSALIPEHRPSCSPQ